MYSQFLQSPCFCKQVINADFGLLLCCYLRCDYLFIFYNYGNIIFYLLIISLLGTDLAGLIFWISCRNFRNKGTSQVMWKCLWSEISTCYFIMSYRHSSQFRYWLNVLELVRGLLTVQLVAAADLVISLLNECSKNILLNLDTFSLPGGAGSRFYLGSAYWNPLFQYGC